MKNLSHRSISLRILLLECAAFLAVIITAIVFNVYLLGQLARENKLLATERIMFSMERYSQWEEAIVSLSTTVARNPQIQRYLTDDEVSRARNFTDLRRNLNNTQYVRSEITDIFITDSKSKFYYANDAMTTDELQKTIDQVKKSQQLMICYDNGTIAGDRPVSPTIIIAIPAYSLYSNFEVFNKFIGVVVVVADSDEVMKNIVVSGEGLLEQRVYSASGELIYSESEGGMLEELYDAENVGTVEALMQGNEKYFLASSKTDDGNFTVVQLSSSAANKSFRQLYIIEMLFIAMLAAILMIEFLLLNRSLIKPIRDFIDHLGVMRKNVGKDYRLEVTGGMEMQRLGKEFNSMIEERKNWETRVIELRADLNKSELMLKQAEIALLKSQINPHFLTNSLESIHGLALRDGYRQVAEILKQLGSVLGYSLRSPEYVELNKELSMLQSYLIIQQFRYNNRFDWSIEKEDDVGHLKIPNMILQPLVENAIEHGFRNIDRKGMLKVEAYKKENILFIRILDNGQGMEKGVEQTIKERLRSIGPDWFVHPKSGHGFGIANVNGRINLLWGDKSGVELESQAGQGTTLTIKLVISENENV